jgi:phosphoglycolate phosphatase
MLTGIKNLIWDWNGTLLDDVDICVESINVLLRKRRLPLMHVGRYKELFTFPVRDYYEQIGFDFQQESYDEVAMEFMSAYLERFPNAHLHPQVIPLLNAVREKGYQQSVLSAMEQDTLNISIASKGITHYFSNIVGINNHFAVGKLENARHILHVMECEPSEVLLIGDTLHDQEVAIRIGCPYLLVGSGHQSTRRLAATGGRVAETLDDLMAFFN